MRRIGYTAAAMVMGLAMLLPLTAAVEAQKTTETAAGKGGSPHVKTEWTIDGANLSIEYGRPYFEGPTRSDAHAGRQAVADRR
jgi:hypothetical protein